MKWWQGILLGAAIAVAVFASFRIGYFFGQKRPQSGIAAKADTLFVSRVDTLILRPIPARERVTDTIRVLVRDTIEVALPRTEVEYTDTSYYARVSGYAPRLDSLVVYPRIYDRRITIGRAQPSPKWGVGISAGPAVGYFATPAGWQPGAGISVQAGIFYRF